MQRRPLLALLLPAGLALAGCGFRLRGSQTFAFDRIAVLPHPGGPLAIELRRSFGPAVQVLAPQAPLTQAQVVLDLFQEQREKTVVGVNASGQVREFQLRIRVRFGLRTPQGAGIDSAVRHPAAARRAPQGRLSEPRGSGSPGIRPRSRWPALRLPSQGTCCTCPDRANADRACLRRS